MSYAEQSEVTPNLLKEIDKLKKEIKVLRLALQSHGEIVEINYKLSQEIGKLKKMIIALDNGITLNCEGLTYKNGEFYEQRTASRN